MVKRVIDRNELVKLFNNSEAVKRSIDVSIVHPFGKLLISIEKRGAKKCLLCVACIVVIVGFSFLIKIYADALANKNAELLQQNQLINRLHQTANRLK